MKGAKYASNKAFVGPATLEHSPALNTGYDRKEKDQTNFRGSGIAILKQPKTTI